MERLRHRGPGLLREAVLQQRRQVDAPQQPATVEHERLEQDAGREATRDTGLDDPLGAQVPRQTPREAAQANVSVVPPAEGAATHQQPAGAEVGRGGVPHTLEPLLLLARPRRAEQVVNLLLAWLRRLVRPGWPAPLEPVGEPLERALDALVGLSSDRLGRAHGVSEATNRPSRRPRRDPVHVVREYRAAAVTCRSRCVS